MKKKVVLVLTLMMLVALVACGGKSGTQQTAQQNAILGRWEIKEGRIVHGFMKDLNCLVMELV